MPFTPFHLGPGALFKAIGGDRFSFMVFGGAQVLMDIEPLIGLIRGWPVLHGYTHTVAGALAIGAVAALTGKPISTCVLRLLGMLRQPLTWTACFAGGLLGTFSHILFDAVMHADMNPWSPFAQGNALLRLIPVGDLHLVCLAMGGAGVAIIALKAALQSGRHRTEGKP